MSLEIIDPLAFVKGFSLFYCSRPRAKGSISASPCLSSFSAFTLILNVHNLQTLYKVTNVPSDTHMREVLDEVDPKALRETFLSVFHEAQRGKLLERYSFFGGYLCLVDGTEIFNSEKIHCKNCCKKEHQDGRVTYHLGFYTFFEAVFRESGSHLEINYNLEAASSKSVCQKRYKAEIKSSVA